ncbi:unnamed protein product [Toxocara canis]|uniref:Uncharacterized protein n=1 Tax=Toxocara canis TaxID=6265 RepID=A0A183UVE9_TOXCA|nr:unnamed protein product [Toxocara canis]
MDTKDLSLSVVAALILVVWQWFHYSAELMCYSVRQLDPVVGEERDAPAPSFCFYGLLLSNSFKVVTNRRSLPPLINMICSNGDHVIHFDHFIHGDSCHAGIDMFYVCCTKCDLLYEQVRGDLISSFLIARYVSQLWINTRYVVDPMRGTASFHLPEVAQRVFGQNNLSVCWDSYLRPVPSSIGVGMCVYSKKETAPEDSFFSTYADQHCIVVVGSLTAEIAVVHGNRNSQIKPISFQQLYENVLNMLNYGVALRNRRAEPTDCVPKRIADERSLKDLALSFEAGTKRSVRNASACVRSRLRPRSSSLDDGLFPEITLS